MRNNVGHGFAGKDSPRDTHENGVSDRGLRDEVDCLHDVDPVINVVELVFRRARIIDERVQIMPQTERDCYASANCHTGSE